MVENEIRTLRHSMPMLEDHDALEQEMAMHGLEPTPDSELNRLKRYENACLRRMQWSYTKLMARKRSQWPSAAAPMEREMPADPEPEMSPDPMPAPPPEPETDYDAIPAEHREFARFVDAAMEPDKHDPYIVFNYLKQLELTAEANAKLANEALAEAAAPPVPPAPPKPSEPVRPAPQFKGNRRARKAAARKARKSG